MTAAAELGCTPEQLAARVDVSIEQHSGLRVIPAAALRELVAQKAEAAAAAAAAAAERAEANRRHIAELAAQYSDPVHRRVAALQRYQQAVDDPDMSRSALATMTARDKQADLDGYACRCMDSWLSGKSAGATHRLPAPQE